MYIKVLSFYIEEKNDFRSYGACADVGKINQQPQIFSIDEMSTFAWSSVNFRSKRVLRRFT